MQTAEDVDRTEDELRAQPKLVFSPAAADDNHLTKIATAIDGATETIDIAIYSYSDAKISAALERASARGVKVRFLYQDGGDNFRLAEEARARSTSGKLEVSGVDVRFMTKIMHHKFMIVDGPKSVAARAKTALLVTGSANWSSSAATRFDENTLFLRNEAELVLRFQREFNLLWDHSRDFVQASFDTDTASLEVTDATITDRANVDVFFTSKNFTVRNTTFSLTGANEVADALIAGIKSARTSIHIASGHLRSRPVAEALMAKKAEVPTLDVRVYLDGQEYISRSGNTAQETDLRACLEGATTDAQRRNCTDSGFLFGHNVGKAGIDVRYKFYAYRWNHGYAPQMHNKYMIVDSATLFTGSYNLSDNAEHATFENMMRFNGAEYKATVRAFEDQFEVIWKTARDEGTLAELTRKIETDDEFPLVFDPMSLTWDEVTTLKGKIKDNCSTVDSPAFRSAPGSHMRCRRAAP